MQEKAGLMLSPVLLLKKLSAIIKYRGQKGRLQI